MSLAQSTACSGSGNMRSDFLPGHSPPPDYRNVSRGPIWQVDPVPHAADGQSRRMAIRRQTSVQQQRRRQVSLDILPDAALAAAGLTFDLADSLVDAISDLPPTHQGRPLPNMRLRFTRFAGALPGMWRRASHQMTRTFASPLSRSPNCRLRLRDAPLRNTWRRAGKRGIGTMKLDTWRDASLAILFPITPSAPSAQPGSRAAPSGGSPGIQRQSRHQRRSWPKNQSIRKPALIILPFAPSDRSLAALFARAGGSSDSTASVTSTLRPTRKARAKDCRPTWGMGSASGISLPPDGQRARRIRASV